MIDGPGILIDGGPCLGINRCVLRTDATTGVGLAVYNGASVDCSSLIIDGFRRGLYATYGSSVLGPACVSGASLANIDLEYGSVLHNPRLLVTGSGYYGLLVGHNSKAETLYCKAIGNAGIGMYAYMNSMIYGTECYVFFNSIGLLSEANSVVHAATTFTNRNTVGIKANNLSFVNAYNSWCPDGVNPAYDTVGNNDSLVKGPGAYP